MLRISGTNQKNTGAGTSHLFEPVTLRTHTNVFFTSLILYLMRFSDSFWTHYDPA
jgi:hypothetical protein